MTDKLLIPPRAHSYPGEVLSVKTGCGTVFVAVTVDNTGYPLETFALGKGGCMSVCLEALGRATSVALRCGVDANELVVQYRHLICPSVAWDRGRKVQSCAAALAIAIQEMMDKYEARKQATASGSGSSPCATGPALVDEGEEDRVAQSNLEAAIALREEQGLR